MEHVIDYPHSVLSSRHDQINLMASTPTVYPYHVHHTSSRESHTPSTLHTLQHFRAEVRAPARWLDIPWWFRRFIRSCETTICKRVRYLSNRSHRRRSQSQLNPLKAFICWRGSWRNKVCQHTRKFCNVPISARMYWTHNTLCAGN